MKKELNEYKKLKSDLGNNAVLYLYNDIKCVRVKPFKYNASKSKLLKFYQNKFKLCMNFVALTRKDLINKIWAPQAKNFGIPKRIEGFQKRARRISGSAYFCKINLSLFEAGLDYIDQDKIFISHGHLSTINNLNAEYDLIDKDKILIGFEVFKGIDSSVLNQFLGVMAITKDEFYFLDLPDIKRKSGGGEFRIQGLNGQKVRLHFYFQNEKMTEFSKSSTVLLQ